jgi:hypothetical protein
MNPRLFKMIIKCSKKKGILSLTIWIVLLYLLPTFKFQMFPLQQSNEYIIESNTPMVSQAVIEDVLTNPIEVILSTKKSIKSFETFIENGRFRIKVFLHDKVDSLIEIQNIKREISTFEKNLPSEYSRINVSMHSTEDEPDLIFAFESEELSKSAILTHLNDLLKTELLSTRGVRQIKVYGQEKYNYTLNYDSKKLSLQKINSSQLLYDISTMATQVIDKEKNRMEGWNPLIDSKDKLFLSNNLVIPSDSFTIAKTKAMSLGIHRINSKELPVLCIYTENYIASIYLYTLIHFNHILNIITIPENIKTIPIYFSFYENSKYIYENLLFITIPILLIFIKNNNRNNSFRVQFIKSILNSLPILFIITFLFDKKIDICIIYSLLFSLLFFYFHLPKLNMIQTQKQGYNLYLEVILKIMINSTLIYVIIKLLKEEGVLFYKTLFQFSSFTIYFLFFYLFSKSEKTYKYPYRFISFQIYKTNSFFLAIYVLLNNKINSIFTSKLSKINQYVIQIKDLHDKYKNKISHSLFSYILFIIILSICYYSSLEFPFHKGGVIMGILEMPAGTSLNYTDSISAKIEFNLISTKKVVQVYSHVQNEQVKYYIKYAENEILNEDEIKQISRLANPGYFYIPSLNNRNTKLQEIQFYGNNYNTLQNSISLFTKKILESNPEIEIILKYKPPFKNLLMIPNSQKLSFANIPPSTFAYNTKLQLSGAIFTRIFENGEIRDFRLEQKNKSTEIKQWESDFQIYNRNILYNKNYSQFETIEEFSIYRKKNGKKILSLLLKDYQDQYYLTKTINEIEKINEIVIQYKNIQNKDSYYYLLILSILLL